MVKRRGKVGAALIAVRASEPDISAVVNDV